MLPITRQISNYNHYGRGSNNIKYIVLHYTANQNGTAKNHADYIGRSDVGASAHYFVDNNSIYQVIEDDCGAWQVGDGHGAYGITNTNSIGIEMCCMDKNCQISAQTESNALELTKYLMDKYDIDIDHVVRHYDASRKICPNWSDNNWARWWSFKKKLSSTQVKEEEYVVNKAIEVFCEKWYVDTYSDVRNAIEKGLFKSGYEHWVKYGQHEKNRKPNIGLPSDWNEAIYLYNNPDVNKNVSTGFGYVSGAEHYLKVGYRESGRKDTWKTIKVSTDTNNTDKKEDNKKNIETYFRVVAGSYKDKKNAEEQKDKLEKLGVDGVFLTTFEKEI